MFIYKILSEAEWQNAHLTGAFLGSEVDLKDGYIHFSTRDQVEETANKHFKGQNDLILLAIDGALLGDALVYEPSRGGQLFPHLYGSLAVASVHAHCAFMADAEGQFIFPAGFAA